MNNNNLAQRNSSIEILRIIGTFFIILTHAITTTVNFEFNNRLSNILIYLISYFGNIGDLIFISASTIFLVDSKSAKPEKAVYLIILETLTASVRLAIKIGLGIHITNADIKYAISPFLTDKYWWFIHAYVIYYLLHGYINIILSNISKKTHFGLCFFCIVLYSIAPMFTHIMPPMSSFTCFIMIHIIISFINKYDLSYKIQNKKFVIFTGILYLIILLLVYELDIITKTHYFSWRMNVNVGWSYNPFLLLFIISLIFNRKNNIFYNKYINIVGSLSVYLYVVHNYSVINAFLKEKIWLYLNGLLNYDLDRYLYILIVILFYLFYLIISLIYKKIFDKPLKLISKKIINKVNLLFDDILKIMNI